MFTRPSAARAAVRHGETARVSTGHVMPRSASWPFRSLAGVGKCVMSEDASHHGSGDFTELQRALLGTQTIEQFLQQVALLAARLVPGTACHAGRRCGPTDAGRSPSPAAMKLASRGRRPGSTSAAMGRRRHALRQGCTVRVEDTATGSDRPGFGAEAASLGIGSCLALPLIADGKPVGRAQPVRAGRWRLRGGRERGGAEQLAGNASWGRCPWPCGWRPTSR